MKHEHKGCSCHLYGSHAHDHDKRRPIHDGRVIGNGIERTREHDKGLEKELRVWRRNIEFCGGRIVAEHNANDLNRMLSQRINRKVSHAEKQATADSLGFSMYAGSVQVPDHRMVIVWADGRTETKDFEHINPNTYNSHQRRAKISSGAHISGLNDGRGRRVRNGPDVIGPLMGKPQKIK